MKAKEYNKKYFKEERENKNRLLELYRKQDEKIIKEMNRSFDIRFALSVVIVIYGIGLLVFFTYINLGRLTW